VRRRWVTMVLVCCTRKFTRRGFQFYYVYGFMLLVYIMLVIVSICVTIVSTYFLLNAEDYR
jgi:hypothetical protein